MPPGLRTALAVVSVVTLAMGGMLFLLGVLELGDSTMTALGFLLLVVGTLAGIGTTQEDGGPTLPNLPDARHRRP